MLFNSLTYAIFLPIVFVLYWFYLDKSVKLQNWLLLGASYIFYGWWDVRFLGLIFLSSVVDYFLGFYISSAANSKRKVWLGVSIALNLGLLAYFKYLNFFIESFVDLSTALGLRANITTLEIILPVGISFYTFQSLSYTIDVYRNKIQPTRDAVSFFTYVAFFPQLVAGPIERAINLLPQFYSKRIFTYANGVEAMRLIVWGLFKKVVVADNCAIYVDTIFAKYQAAPPDQLLMALVLFSFQIYGDFSGYSDIARGSAKLFGFDLMQNFNAPYFARDIAEFWRRWHISLTSWFKDYLYIPLGGSRNGKWMAIRNTLIIFLVSGFWHGAKWTFLFWGLLHALYFIPLLLTGKNRQHIEYDKDLFGWPSFKGFIQVVFTFCLVTFAWLFFRADSMQDSFLYLKGIFSPGLNVEPLSIEMMGLELLVGVCVVLIFFEWLFKGQEIPFATLQQRRVLRYLSYAFICFLIVFYGAYINPQSFIYFQF